MKTTNTVQYKDFSEFIAEHNAKKLDKEMTHTRIASPELNIYGGNYHIEPEELETFHRLYYEHVFVKGRKEYLTEKQLQNGTGPILIDFDFRYEYSVTERVHTQEHVQDIIQLYLEELKELLVFEENTPFPIFVMEKPNVNRVADKQITKDGIHIIIGIQMDHILQMILRDKILEKIGDIWELPLTNDWPTVLDEGISKGIINWQLYGSQKPGNEAYRITYYLTAAFNNEENDFVTTAKSVKELDLSRDFKKVSAQYDKNVRFQINPKIMAEYTSKMEQRDKPRTKKSGGAKGKINIVLSEEDEIDVNISPEDIKDAATLKKVVDAIMQQLRTNEQFIRETHEYTQVLPEKYYQPGSHALNIQVAFALKRTDDRLFYSWVMLRSKASDFDYGSIPELLNKWQHNFNKKGNSDGVTRRSIMYWAKQDAFEAYEKVKKSTIDNYIEETIYEAGDWDYAMVLYHMYKDKYVCSSITNKKWYTFKNNRWEKDEGQTLRMAISKDLFQLYSDKQNEYVADMQIAKENEDQHEKIQRKIKKISEVGIKLKKTNDKNNIMREAMEIFFDKEFVKNMDANPYLMCFSNGVVDFKNKTFRQGYPQDYITKTTGIPYVPFNPEANTISEEIITFMEQLFPQKDLCRYMWDHLASTLIGIKKEHAFNIYRGSGSNGKSILTDLMSQSLGDYKGTVPITLVTEKRNTIGGTSSEVIQLKGIRYAVMQEPSKDAVINEGIMKELTGGDPIQARALYSESEIFIPQFSLVVCTNALFEVRGGDDGTWRRMKLVDFVSKFISEGEHHTDDTKHVFPKDKGLKEKLPSWAIVFISMLVKRAFETDGEVVDCNEVKAASNKYRQSQDCIAGFIADKIEKEQGKTVGKKLLNDVFKEWFQMNYGNRKAPKLMELEEAMNKRFETKTEGKGDTRKWVNIRIKSDIDELDDDANPMSF